MATITPIVGYVAATVPAQVIRAASGTTLFHIAMYKFGNALNWTSVARLNGLIDPWIQGQEDISIPPTIPPGVPTGILGY